MTRHNLKRRTKAVSFCIHWITFCIHRSW